MTEETLLLKSNFGSSEYLSHGLYWIFESVISVHWIVEFLVVVNWIVGFVIVVFCWVSPSPIIWKVVDVAAVGLYHCSQFSFVFWIQFFFNFLIFLKKNPVSLLKIGFPCRHALLWYVSDKFCRIWFKLYKDYYGCHISPILFRWWIWIQF